MWILSLLLLCFSTTNANDRPCESSSDCGSGEFCAQGVCVVHGRCKQSLDCWNPENSALPFGCFIDDPGNLECETYIVPFIFRMFFGNERQYCRRRCNQPICPESGELCEVDPCEDIICESNPDAVCKQDPCGTCEVSFWTADGFVVTDCEVGCPKDEIFDCAKDPCDGASCKFYPDATCTADYCGGCNAVFTIDGRDEPADCEACPADQVVDCSEDPCLTTYCKQYPQTMCVLDTCGGCTPTFFDQDGVELTDCEECTACLEDPCLEASCPNHPFARCEADPCNDCKPVFRDSNDVEVDCGSCTADDLVACLVDPCDESNCTAIPDANCTAGYCGGCNAIFTNEDGDVIEC